MTSVSLLVVAALRLSEPGWFIARFDEAIPEYFKAAEFLKQLE